MFILPSALMCACGPLCGLPARRNPHGGFFSHCGDTCRYGQCNHTLMCACGPLCGLPARRNPHGGFFSHCGDTCRRRRCNHTPTRARGSSRGKKACRNPHGGFFSHSGAAPAAAATIAAPAAAAAGGTPAIADGVHAVTEEAPGGATTVASNYKGKRVGLMVAANSGRPGGSVGRMGGSGGINHDKIRGDHKTQEEDIVSNWLITSAKKEGREHVFKTAVGGRWGFNGGGANDFMTIQGVDYVNTTDSSSYRQPAHVVPDAWVSPKTSTGYFCKKDRYQVDLVFVAGPNACASKGGIGSMDRTANTKARGNYAFFKDCIAEALAAGLDKMIDNEVKIALVATLSTGVYAGEWRDQIGMDFMSILDKVLEEPHVKDGLPRYKYFHKVVVPKLA